MHREGVAGHANEFTSEEGTPSNSWSAVLLRSILGAETKSDLSHTLVAYK